MKWIVFSDSHGVLDYMRRAVEREQPDQILHLGDVVRDASKLHQMFPDIPLKVVRGNCDFSSHPDVPETLELPAAGSRLWMLHGHTHSVKLGTSSLVEAALSRGVDAVLFGHTHKPLCWRYKKLWVVNPGTVSGVPKATYGVLELDETGIFCRIAALP